MSAFVEYQRKQESVIGNELPERKRRIRRRKQRSETRDRGLGVLPDQPAEERLFPGFAIDFGDGFGERYVFGTDLDAVLRVGTLVDAAGTKEALDAFFGVHRARRMHVEEADLRNDRGANELVPFVDLRANFQATAARDAARKRIAFFLNFGGHARTFAEVVGAVDGDPGLNALQGVEHELAIYGEIADNRKFGHGFEADGVLELVDKSRTGHLGPAVDDHGAGTADFFEAIGFVGDRSGLFAIASDRIFGDIAKTDDHVHRRTPFESEFFPVGGLFGARLAFDPNDNLFFAHKTSEKRILRRRAPQDD